MNNILTTHGYFAHPSYGKPVANGYIYIGIQDLDPEVVANQKQMKIQQEDGTVVNVAQPLRTSAGGVPLYNSSPVTIVTEGNYSLKVMDSYGSQVYYIPSVVP